jgi:hypothetical protein
MNNFKTLIHVLFLACANNTYTFINIIMPPYTNPQGQVNCTEKGFGHIGDSEIFSHLCLQQTQAKPQYYMLNCHFVATDK